MGEHKKSKSRTTRITNIKTLEAAFAFFYKLVLEVSVKGIDTEGE
jgi:hypothetical protein